MFPRLSSDSGREGESSPRSGLSSQPASTTTNREACPQGSGWPLKQEPHTFHWPLRIFPVFLEALKFQLKAFYSQRNCTEEGLGQIKPLMASKHPDLRHSSTSFLGPCSAHKLLLWLQGTGASVLCNPDFSCSDNRAGREHLTLRRHSHACHSTPKFWIKTSKAQSAVGSGREGVCGLPWESHLRAPSKERKDPVCQSSTGVCGRLQKPGCSESRWSYQLDSV